MDETVKFYNQRIMKINVNGIAGVMALGHSPFEMRAAAAVAADVS